VAQSGGDLVQYPGAKTLARASFASIGDLRKRILTFIDYFNKTMAKPF